MGTHRPKNGEKPTLTLPRMPFSIVLNKGTGMLQKNKVESMGEIIFEPSELVEYGDVSEMTQGGTGTPAQPDGAVYSS